MEISYLIKELLLALGIIGVFYCVAWILYKKVGGKFYSNYGPYLDKKKQTLSSEDFEKLLVREEAELRAMRGFIKSKGRIEDSRYQKILEKIESEKNKISSNKIIEIK